jgi:hypothetical protein
VGETIVSRTDGFLPESWFINPLGINLFVTDECPVATGDQELTTQLHEADTLYLVTDAEPGFPEVAINPQKLVDFHILADHQNVTFKQHLLGGSGTDCAGQDGSRTCSQSVTGNATVTLHRIALYRTKHRYIK